MPGAHIAIDQDRPGPIVSTGLPDQARNDLWVGRLIKPRSVDTASAYLWTMLDQPPGSAATIASPGAQQCSFTADLPGSYRIQLTINGGGLGNSQILIAACAFDVNGVETNSGWRFPALGEVPSESNFGGQTRGYDEAVRNIFSDLLEVVTVYDEGVLAGKRPKLNFIGAGVTAVDNPGQGRVDVTVTGLTVQDEGTPIGTFPTMNFVGAGIQATDAGGGVIQVSVLGLSVRDEGSLLGTFPLMDFTGPGVTTTNAGGGVAEVAIPGGIPRVELTFRSGTFETELAIPRRVGGRVIDLGDYPATLGTLTRSITFLADLEVSSGSTVGNVRLQNMTDNETVTGTELTTSSLSSVQLSAALTAGVSAGNLKTGKLYEVQVSLSGGGINDRVSITNARLLVRYA